MVKLFTLLIHAKDRGANRVRSSQILLNLEDARIILCNSFPSMMGKWCMIGGQVILLRWSYQVERGLRKASITAQRCYRGYCSSILRIIPTTNRTNFLDMESRRALRMFS